MLKVYRAPHVLYFEEDSSARDYNFICLVEQVLLLKVIRRVWVFYRPVWLARIGGLAQLCRIFSWISQRWQKLAVLFSCEHPVELLVPAFKTPRKIQRAELNSDEVLQLRSTKKREKYENLKSQRNSNMISNIKRTCFLWTSPLLQSLQVTRRAGSPA